jgi:hypothetical protein
VLLPFSDFLFLDLDQTASDVVDYFLTALNGLNRVIGLWKSSVFAVSQKSEYLFCTKILLTKGRYIHRRIREMGPWDMETLNMSLYATKSSLDSSVRELKL